MKNISMIDGFGEEHVVPESELIDRVSSYGILIKDSKLLLIQDKNSKTWEFPGGGLEKGESKEEGLVREFFEETGLEVDPSKIKFFKDFQDYFYSTLYKQAWNSLRHFYSVEVTKGDLLKEGNSDDTVASGYFNKEEVESLKIKPKIRALIQEVFTGS